MGFMAEAVKARVFNNVWVCMKCNATIKGSKGKKPHKCRKCNSSQLRLKKKGKKA